jgi:hypothetical protein
VYAGRYLRRNATWIAFVCVVLLALVAGAPLLPGRRGRRVLLARSVGQLLAPIALYPDPLLPQVLLAATFPDQVDEAARFVRGSGSDDREYFTQPLDTTEDGLAVYAQRFISTPGKHDGLYWDAPEDDRPSPFGNLIAEAGAEGYPAGRRPPAKAEPPAPRPRSPYHGYYFRILKARGPHAPGGKFSYVLNGHMLAGYALAAWPDKWGSSGVMTFIVNQQGRVYQKNLGRDTAHIAGAMKEYDPDPTWTLVKEP